MVLGVESEIDEKDGSRLFKDVDTKVFAAKMRELIALREAHPGYRDDQLLMYMLCAR